MTSKFWFWSLFFGLLVVSPAFGGEPAVISPELQALFKRLDELGRDKIAKAKYVSLSFKEELNARQSRPEHAWLIGEDNDAILVLEADLLPWRYHKKGVTTLPASWQPREVVLKSVEDADFETTCKQLAQPMPEEEGARRLYTPGPSRQLLAAHAAWKKGLTKYVEPILNGEPTYKEWRPPGKLIQDI